MYRRIVTPSSVYSAVVTAGRFANIALILAVAARYSPSFVGEFAVLQAASGFLITTLSFSLGPALNVSASEMTSPQRRFVPVLFGAIYSIACALIAALAILSQPIHFGVRSADHSLFLISLVLNGVVQAVLGSALIGCRRLVTPAIASALPPVAMLTLVSFDLLSPGSFLFFYAATLTASATCSIVDAMCQIRSLTRAKILVLGFARDNARKFIAFGFKTTLASSAIGFTIWRLQSHLVATAGPDQNAIFAIGGQFFNVILFIPATISPLMLSFISRNRDGALRAVVMMTAAVFLLCVLGITVWTLGARNILAVLPPLYRQAEPAILWSMVGASILFIKSPSAIYMQSIFKTTQEVYASLVAAGLSLTYIKLSSLSSGTEAAAVRAAMMLLYFLFTMPALIYYIKKRRSNFI